MGARQAVLTGMSAVCAGCWAVRGGGGGVGDWECIEQHAGSPVGQRLTEARQKCCSG